MSMLSLQADSLRKYAERLRQLANGAVNQGFPARQDLYESAAEMREAADTIEGLRDRLQELQGVGVESRYAELFGTPERAARTLKKLIEDGPFLIKEDRDSFKPAKVCDLLDELCGGCGKCPSCVNAHETEYSIKFECNGGDYDALLEWLKGETE